MTHASEKKKGNGGLLRFLLSVFTHTLRFCVETGFAYVFAILLFIPIYNVFIYRHIVDCQLVRRYLTTDEVNVIKRRAMLDRNPLSTIINDLKKGECE